MSTIPRTLPALMQPERALDHTTAAPRADAVVHMLSVDVEDYFQVEAFSNVVSRESWPQWPSRVVANTMRVLDLLDLYGARGTFFFVGWIAERFPGLVREVMARGHEVGCHSYWHRPVYTLTPREFLEDTRRARDVIEQAAGIRVTGYRAPTWSIIRRCWWALQILAEEGFSYDSSIFPILHDLYGVPGARRFPYTHELGDGMTLKEIPPCAIRWIGLNFPAAGGGYLRLFPLLYTRWVFAAFGRHYHQPLMVYFHPWELDPDQPRIKGRLKSRFRHYTCLGRMEQRIRFLAGHYKFQPVCEFLRNDGCFAAVEPAGEEAQSAVTE